MGYEIKISVFEASKSGIVYDNLWLDENGHAQSLYMNDEGQYYYFGPDGNQAIYPELYSKPVLHSAKFANIIASVDLCKVGSGNIAELNRNTNKNLPQFFYYEGDSIMLFDMYDDAVRAHKIQDVISALEADIKDELDSGERPYRRFTTALGLLKAMQGNYHNLAVLFWGH